MGAAMIGAGLAGRTALVTGTAHGIGAAIAEVLADERATVHGVDKDELDVTDSDAVTAYVARLRRVDVLVNCAGGVVGQVHQPVEDVTDQDWTAVLAPNLTSTFLMTRAVAPGMKDRGWGPDRQYLIRGRSVGQPHRHPGLHQCESRPDRLHPPDGTRTRSTRRHGELHRPGIRPLQPCHAAPVGKLRA